MKKDNSIRTGRNCVSHLHVHLVFVAKYRRQIFDAKAMAILLEVFGKVCRDFGTELIECNGESDHVHLLIHYPPKIAISSLVNSLKGVSSRILRKRYPKIAEHYYKGVLWSPSYFAASCGGAPLSVLRHYIEQQKLP